MTLKVASLGKWLNAQAHGVLHFVIRAAKFLPNFLLQIESMPQLNDGWPLRQGWFSSAMAGRGATTAEVVFVPRGHVLVFALRGHVLVFAPRGHVLVFAPRGQEPEFKIGRSILKFYVFHLKK